MLVAAVDAVAQQVLLVEMVAVALEQVTLELLLQELQTLVVVVALEGQFKLAAQAAQVLSLFGTRYKGDLNAN
jgi:hypothetical protein